MAASVYIYIYIHTYVCKHIRNISPRNMWTLPSHHIYSWHLPIRSVLSCSIQFYPSTRSQSSRHPILRQRRAEVAFHQLEGRSQTALVEEGFEEGQAKDAAHAFWILSCGWWGHPSHPGYPGGVILRYSKILFQVYEVYYIIFVYIYIQSNENQTGGWAMMGYPLMLSRLNQFQTMILGEIPDPLSSWGWVDSEDSYLWWPWKIGPVYTSLLPHVPCMAKTQSSELPNGCWLSLPQKSGNVQGV